MDDGECLRGYRLLHEPEEHGFGRACTTRLKSAVSGKIGPEHIRGVVTPMTKHVK